LRKPVWFKGLSEKRQAVLAITFRVAKVGYHSPHQMPDMEGQMVTNTEAGRRTDRSSTWQQFTHHVSEWHSRYRWRQELAGLSDSALRDIGITRCDARREIQKPFWMA